MVILNADGVYLTCYSALHLNLQLSLAGFYSDDAEAADDSLTLTSREAFMSNILGSGLLVYVSPVWLSEVYDLVTEIDVFQFGVTLGLGSSPSGSGKVKGKSLRNLLVDLDGLNRSERGAQLLCEYRRFQNDPNWNRKDDGENTRSIPE